MLFTPISHTEPYIPVGNNPLQSAGYSGDRFPTALSGWVSHSGVVRELPVSFLGFLPLLVP